MADSAPPASPAQPFLCHLDALLLVALTLARVRIDTLAEAAVLPLRQNDVVRHPWLGRLLTPEAMTLLAQQQTADPIGLLLIVATLGCLLTYLLVATLARPTRGRHITKLVLIWAIILLTVFASSLKLSLLRQESGPASYSHDGGVIQTEATIDFLLSGRNPYVEDYTQTPMAEWGINEFRTALYHYPYLPWTFLFSAPFKLVSQAVLGWYDQRFVYLLLFALTLLLATGLAASRERQLLLLMLLGLNPLLGSDVIFGQNDSFILAWIVLSLWLWRQAVLRSQRGARAGSWRAGSAVAFGLACASKPTAWFFVPFYLLLVVGGDPRDLWRRPGAWLGRAVKTGWPAAVTALVIIGPYFLWQPAAMIDDVWRWSAGTSETAYQIWGWGASNLLLAFGWVQDRFTYWPFWVPELAVGVLLMIGLLKRQAGANTPAHAVWGYSLWLFAFFFVSRFLNENYLGFILAGFTLGALIDTGTADEVPRAGAEVPDPLSRSPH